MNTIDSIITGYTLVDITRTGVIRDVIDPVARDQQRNWETVLQCIGLRAQPLEIQYAIDTHDMKHMEFGEMYHDIQKVWSFAFVVEHNSVFNDGKRELGLLEDAFDEVPVVTGLHETARFILPIFHTRGPIKNIYFKSAPIGLNK